MKKSYVKFLDFYNFAVNVQDPNLRFVYFNLIYFDGFQRAIKIHGHYETLIIVRENPCEHSCSRSVRHGSLEWTG